MKRIITIYLLTFFFIASIISNKNNLRKNIEEKYQKLEAIHLLTFISNKNIYIVDTREFTISNEGYIKNSIILPITFSYSTWFPSIIKEGSNVVLICDEENYENAIKQTEALGPYHILGYAIYNEIIEKGNLNIQKAEYNENTKEDVEILVRNGEYMVDLREISEFKETGVIKEAELIPLSTFRNDYVKMPTNRDIYVYCKLGKRALIGMTYAKRAGYTNRFVIMRGGMNQTIHEGYPLVPYTE
jgi:rhodanese-related sulfurtransferase